MKLKRCRRIARARTDERGAALLSSLLVMLLMAGVTAGFTALVITDTKVRSLDSARTQAFYAVHAGLEKLTADLGDLFAVNVAPTAAQVTAIAGTPPTTLGITWTEPDGTDGYRVNFPTDAGGNPSATVMTVQNGPFQGLVGLATPYTMTATGHLADGSEASLTRILQTVAIPVFQFGIFSENDLSFFAGPDFNFGGRVHSNSNVFLAQGNGATLSLADRVTSVGEIVRTNLSNGWDVNTDYQGTVRAITTPGNFRSLAVTEGSLTGTLGSALNEPTWTNLSTGPYNHNVMNSRTGARRLDLPITQFGAAPIDLIKRPVVNENVAAPLVLAERFYSLASLRILLSDTAAEITNLPGVSAAAPLSFNWNATAPADANPVGWVVGATTPNIAVSPGPQAGAFDANAALGGSRSPANTPLLGGFIKIEMQNNAGVWSDVTLEILRLGIAAKQDNIAGCADPSPDAILRIQRYRDDQTCWETNDNGALQHHNNNTKRQAATAFSPMVFYDPREGTLRDTNPAAVDFGGIMHYIEIDARNLSRWFRGQIPGGSCPIACTGANALFVNGYTVYVSDRRGNKNAGVETGEYGFEDFVNPLSATGTPNGVLDVGEDANGDGVLQVYGQTPIIPAGMTAPFIAATRPWTSVDPANALGFSEETGIARRNPAIFFRRAIKLTNGADLLGAAPGLTGLTIASENPVYVQGNWNANGTFAGNHVATAVLADAVTLLSGNWNDLNSFTNAFNMGNRDATTSWYRLAIIAGKGRTFPQPGVGAPPEDYGTDGGAHNFLRYIEDWSNQTLNYRGSIANMYFSRQATGTYKCCAIVYSPPTRGYNFDVEFLTPALLPPRTPMFRDVNITGFAQIIKP
jgi:hypothetical protein